MRLNDCTDPRSTRLGLIMPIKLIVVHHCSLSRQGLDVPNPIPDAYLTGLSLSRMFEARPAAEPNGLGTGGCRPYHALIRVDGQVDQCLSLARRGAHALAYNVSSLAVATAGEGGLTVAQSAALVELLADWLMYAEGVPVVGHSALPDGTTPGHPVCPHPSTDLAKLAGAAISFAGPASCAMTPDQRTQAIRERGWII